MNVPEEEEPELLQSDATDGAVAGTRRTAEIREEELSGGSAPPAELLRTRLSSRRAYWLATMRQMGTICALTLSILTAGYRLEWDPTTGPPPAVHLANAKSAYESRDFVLAAIADGVGLGTMAPCARGLLTCILPLGVAVNSAGKKRLIWDGRHVNRHLPFEPFRMDSLQREGRSLFETAGYGVRPIFRARTIMSQCTLTQQPSLVLSGKASATSFWYCAPAGRVRGRRRPLPAPLRTAQPRHRSHWRPRK